MNRKLSDEQLDRIAKNLLRNFPPDDETLAEIPESPRLWWNVRSRIETEKARRGPAWFAALRPSIFAFGALAVFACLGLAVLFLNAERNSDSGLARQQPDRNLAGESFQTPAAATPEVLPKIASREFEAPKNPPAGKVPRRNSAPPARPVAGNRNAEIPTKRAGGSSEISPSRKVEETKTDFIALSYAGGTDSGQVVRVKVPSSMMISLGVATNVEKESKMVSAEVVIGDDGLARAIRFIR